MVLTFTKPWHPSDPINPFGDFRRMQSLKQFLRQDGMFFLSVPVGNDTLVFNAHRIYGDVGPQKSMELQLDGAAAAHGCRCRHRSCSCLLDLIPTLLCSGPIRLPKLVKGWKIVGTYKHYNLEQLFSSSQGSFQQPIVTLQRV